MLKLAPRSRFGDTANGYGWGSIVLHWLTAVVVLALLFIGSSIAGSEAEQRGALIRLHTSIAVAAYVILWWRIVWRFRKGHPGPLTKQPRMFFLIGKYVHFAMLIAMAAMLVSGPLMVWSQGQSIGVFGWFEIPSPLPASHALRDALHSVHANAAIVIAVGVALHLAGVYKHAAFDQDGTFGKMLVPERHDNAAAQNDPGSKSASAKTGS